MASLRTGILDASHRVKLCGIDGKDVSVPILACGTWSWGDKSLWSYDDKKDFTNVEEAWTSLNESGIGFYDTAEVYGKGESERIIGKLLKRTPEEQRSKIIIASKWLPVPILHGRWIPGGGIEGALRKTLKRLEVDSIDLYQVHSAWTYFYSFETIAKSLADCVKKGLTKTIGVSNYSKEQMLTMRDALKKYNIPLASNQIEFSLARTYPLSSGLIQACHDNEIVPLAYSPLAMGRLTGKYSSENPPPSNRRFGNVSIESLESLLGVMRTIAENHKVSCSAVALNYVMVKGCIPLSGAKNVKQAKQNAQALGWRLTEEEIKQLEEHQKIGGTSLWQHG
ncbi:hypothetical protein L7F22_003246 [Adiantum nelumboides]|nr:hypothetical protein [Adiantum nelumboides]